MPEDRWVDPIVEEVHRIRREYSARFNHDLDAILEDLRQEQEKARREGLTIIPAPLREIEKTAEPAA